MLAIRCKEPATCVLGTNSVVTNVDGFILDGVQIRGGSNGLTIKASKNVLVQRSKFIEQVGSGITLYPGTTNENIQIYNNEFRNAVLGCDPNNHENCFYLSDGSPIAEMDYGLRIYSVASMDIKGNQFGTVFNHAISLKANVLFAYMTGNTFNACGRTCIELAKTLPANAARHLSTETYSRDLVFWMCTSQTSRRQPSPTISFIQPNPKSELTRGRQKIV